MKIEPIKIHGIPVTKPNLGRYDIMNNCFSLLTKRTPRMGILSVGRRGSKSEPPRRVPWLQFRIDGQRSERTRRNWA